MANYNSVEVQGWNHPWKTTTSADDISITPKKEPTYLTDLLYDQDEILNMELKRDKIQDLKTFIHHRTKTAGKLSDLVDAMIIGDIK